MTRSITRTKPLSQTISALTTVAIFTSKGSLRRIGIGAPAREGHSLYPSSGLADVLPPRLKGTQAAKGAGVLINH